jgi:4-amino-4-deoxy-L-arabinose transferase-like glycosyltransferase
MNRSPWPRWLPLLIILGAYLVLATMYAVQTPVWQAPDEPAHYNYVRQLANGRLPVMELGDYDEAYKNSVVGSRFAPEYSIEPITYEDWQPPLYYLLLTPVYTATHGSYLALRLVSVLMGAGVIALAYALTLMLLPTYPWAAWTTAVFIAFLPQHIAMLASINNDSLSELLIAALLFLLLRWILQPQTADSWRTPLLMGLLLGCGFLTKAQVYLMAPSIGVALLWRYWGQWRAFIHWSAILFGPAFLLGALWWVRNSLVYGGLDVMGKARHDAIVLGQPRTAEWIADLGLGETITRFFQTTFNSFWGQFGWMAAPMPPWVYAPLALLTLAAAAGLVVAWVKWRHTPFSLSRYTAVPLLLLFFFTVGLHVGYNLTFVQHQGRYLFPALIPIALGFTLGLGAWVLWLQRPLQNRFTASKLTVIVPYLLPIALGLGLAALDLLALVRFIVPNLQP